MINRSATEKLNDGQRKRSHIISENEEYRGKMPVDIGRAGTRNIWMLHHFSFPKNRKSFYNK